MCDLGDIVEVIALAKAGAVIGVKPVIGGLFGPTRATRFQDHLRVERFDQSPTVLRVEATALDEFLVGYLCERRPVKFVDVIPSPDQDVIRRAWEILNHAAGGALTRLQILDLCQLVTERYGGRIEAQIGYGSAEWVEFVKGGRGWLVLWHQPSEAELREIVAFGARGVINGETATAKRPWFAGASGPYLMPKKGLVRFEPGMTPETAWERSGEASGISAAFNA